MQVFHSHVLFLTSYCASFGEFENAVVTRERVRAPRFILFCRFIVVVVLLIIRVSPSIKPSFLFFHNVGTKNVVGFQSSFGELCVIIVVLCTMTGLASPNLLAAVPLLLLSTTVGIFVAPRMLLDFNSVSVSFVLP